MAGRFLTTLLRGLTGSPLAAVAGQAMAASSKAAKAPEAKTSLPDDAMEQRLARLLNDSNPLRRGQLILLEGKKIADQAGAHWDAISERAEAIAAQTVANHQHVGDGYTRIDRLTYFLVFPNKAPGVAEAAAARIVAEMGEKIVGASWTPGQFTLHTVFGSFPDALQVQAIPIPEKPASLLESVLGKLNEAKAARQDPSGAEPQSTLGIIYRPMWDVKYGVLSTYLASPTLKNRDGTTRVGDTDLLGFDTPDLKAKLDATVAEQVAADIGTFIDSAGKILVGIPVHFDTLAASSRRIEFLRACGNIPANARHLVIFELLHAPPGVPASRLQDMCSELKQYSRALIACLPLQTRDLPTYRSAAFNAVGFDLSSIRAQERIVIEQMQQFAIASDKSTIPCFVHGLRSTSLASSAAAAGFRYIDGPTVHSLVEGLQQLRRFSAADLYRTVFTGSRPA